MHKQSVYVSVAGLREEFRAYLAPRLARNVSFDEIVTVEAAEDDASDAVIQTIGEAKVAAEIDDDMGIYEGDGVYPLADEDGVLLGWEVQVYFAALFND